MKKFGKYISCINSVIVLFAMLLSMKNVMIAEDYPIEINLQVPPPYSPYFIDYWEGKGNTVLIIRNTSASSQKIKLAGRISGNNGIVIQSSKFNTPPNPLILSAYESKVLAGRELKPYFNTQGVEVDGIDKTTLLRLGVLPEGLYDICFEALDYDNNSPLSMQYPMGCSSIEMTYPEAPQLISPNDLDTLFAISNQNIPYMFSWMGVIGINSGLYQYNLQIAEMPNPESNPNAVLESTNKYYISQFTTNTNYFTTITDPKFIIGKSYAWRVTVSDPRGIVQFKNNGASEARKFVYSEMLNNIDTIPTDTLKNSLSILIPDCNSKPNTAPEIINRRERIASDKIRRIIKNRYKDDLPIIAVNNVNEFYTLWENSAVKTNQEQYRVKIFNEADEIIYSSIKKFVSNSGELSNAKQNLNYLQKPQSEIYMLEDGKPYYIQIEQLADNLDVVISSSDKCKFRYIVMPDSIPENKQNYTINGNIKYKFQGYAEEYPANLESIQLERYLMVRDSSTGEILADGIETTEYNNSNPSPNIINVPVNSDGTFSHTFAANDKNGYLGTRKFTMIPIVQLHGEKKSTTSIPAGKIYEYYELKLNNPQYVEPKIRVELNDDSLQLGSISTYVWSYTLKVELKQGYQHASMTHSDIDQVNILVSRQNFNKYKKVIPYYEGELVNNSEYALNEQINEKTIYKYTNIPVKKEKDQNGVQHTYIEINKLLVNYMPDDCYELSIRGQNDEELYEAYAHQKYFRFYPASLEKYVYGNNKEYNFKYNTSYTIISKDYPRSSLSGKLVYTDPNNPSSTIKPIADTRIGLMVTYYAEDNSGNKTILDPYHVRKEIENNSNSTVSGSYGTNGIYNNSSDELIEDSLARPFKDGNSIIAWTYTANDGSFLFKDFANLDSLRTIDNFNKSFFANGSHEGKTYAYISNAKLVRTIRLVFPNNEKKYFYCPSKNIDIQPLDSIDIGTLTAYLRTYNLTIKPTKSCTNENETDKGGAIRRAKIKVERLYPLSGFDAQFMSGKENLGEKYAESAEGVKFYGLFLHNRECFNDEYKITTKTNDTIGEYSYYTSIVNFPRAYQEWKKSKEYVNNKGYKGDIDRAEINKINQLFNRKEYDYLFVEDYRPIDMNINVYLEPKLPIISGRVLDASNPMRSIHSGKVFLKTKDGQGKINTEQFRNIGENIDHGYFVFNNLKNINNKLQFDVSGYYLYGAKTIKANGDTSNLQTGKSGQTVLPADPDYLQMKIGQQVHYAQILMMPKGVITGNIVDDSGRAVEAYMRTSSSAMEKTFLTVKIDKNTNINTSRQAFALRVPTGYADSIYIYPKDLKYFNDTIAIPAITDNQAHRDLGNIVVKERLHRMLFEVSDAKTKQVLPNIEVKVLDYTVKTDNMGRAEFIFKNASQKHFWTKVSPPAGSYYMPYETEIENQESRDKVFYKITLNKGFTLRGRVMAKVGSKTKNNNSTSYESIPLKNAEVFALWGEVQVKTTTDQNGYYSLNGIPTSMGYAYRDQKYYQFCKLKCVASKEDREEEGLLGCDTSMYFEKNTEEVAKTCDLMLYGFNQANITALNGFKVKLYAIKPTADSNKFKISGTIDLNYSKSDFVLLDTSKIIKFTDAYVKLSDYKDINSKPYFQIYGDAIQLDVMSLRLKLLGENLINAGVRNAINLKKYDYNILMNPDANSKLNLIAYGENSARMNSKLRIVDNSFNFPGSYFRFNDDQFYLSEKTDENYYNNYLDIFISTSSAGIHRRKNRENYYLSNSNTEPISFKFLNFDASSEIIHSYISYNGQIYLKPLAISTIRLDATNAKSAKEIKIDLPIITVNSEGVSCTAKLNNVIIDLEKWKIEANDCEVSAEKGGLYSTNAKIVTGNLDIQLSEFNLRSDFIYLGKPNLTTLPLGSVSNINIESGAKTFFGFDPRCGNDLAPHYKLTICNESTAGYIKNIPGIYRLDFQAISLISNGEPPIISFAPNSQSIDLFRLVKFRPFTIEAYKDAFTINGALDFNLPRIPNGINYKLEYSKASTASDISFRLLPSNVIFNAPGYTKFESIAGKDEQFLGPNQVKLFGQISEPGKLEPIKVVLTKTIDNGFFPVVDYSIAKNNDFGEQYITLSQNNDKFLIINADMKAKNNDWDLLRLKLKPMGDFADNGFGTKEINFAVFGDVKTDPEVKDQSIEPPPSGGTQLSFGGFDMIFSLTPEPTFFGSMNIPQKSFGAVKFAGTAEILIDKHGFYFVGAGMGNITPLGEFGVGLLIGNYSKGGAFGGISPSAISKVTQYSIGKGLPCAFETANTFQGLFFTGRKSIPMLCYNESVNLVIAAASVHTDAGLEASAWFNFGGESISGGVSMMLYAIAELQMTSISCTDLSARAEGLVKATGSFEGTNVNMDLCASINIFGKLEQRVPALFGCGPLIFSLGSSSDPLLSLKALIGLSNSGFNCSLEKGSCNSNCSSSFK